MSAIYSSYEIKDEDTIEQRQAKLYLAVISLGETLYQKGAAVAELYKDFRSFETRMKALNDQINNYEKEIAKMRNDIHKIRESLSKCSNCGCTTKDGICQNYGCE